MSEQEIDTVPGAVVPKLKMVFRVQTWSIRSRVNRSGREEGESIEMTGHIYAPSIDASTPLSRARAEAKIKGAQDRMSVKIGKEQTIITLPLEDFAFERITGKFKELSGNFGMTVSVEFDANETTDRQVFDFADFAFTNGDSASAPRETASSAAPAQAAPASAPVAPQPANPQLVTR